MNAILVSVDYSDLLSITLPWNRHHFDRVCVVTAPGDPSIEVAKANNAEPFVTDLFYARDAAFNKWAALESALGWFGREGWLCVMDADVLWPKNASEMLDRPFAWSSQPGGLAAGFLYTPLRRMWEDWPLRPNQVWFGLESGLPSETEWQRFPLHPQQREFAGYSQIFHASDPHLGPAPWHDVGYTHAGTADSFFQAKWPPQCKVRPPFEVLHLGPAGQNWCGRATPYADGSVPPDAQACKQQLRALIHSRRHGTPDPYAGERLPPT